MHSESLEIPHCTPVSGLQNPMPCNAIPVVTEKLATVDNNMIYINAKHPGKKKWNDITPQC